MGQDKSCAPTLERVKRWGKSPPPQQRCRGQGKPYGLKDQIDLGQRAARSISFLRKGIPRWVDRWSLGVNQDRDKWQEQRYIRFVRRGHCNRTRLTDLHFFITLQLWQKS